MVGVICQTCIMYVAEKSQCHRWPQTIDKRAEDWCGEWQSKEVIPCLVEEKKGVKDEKVKESNIEDANGLIFKGRSKKWQKQTKHR